MGHCDPWLPDAQAPRWRAACYAALPSCHVDPKHDQGGPRVVLPGSPQAPPSLPQPQLAHLSLPILSPSSLKAADVATPGAAVPLHPLPSLALTCPVGRTLSLCCRRGCAAILSRLRPACQDHLPAEERAGGGLPPSSPPLDPSNAEWRQAQQCSGACCQRGQRMSGMRAEALAKAPEAWGRRSRIPQEESSKS